MRLRRNNIIQTNKITEINEALFIIKHFVDLSAKLLPILAELQLKNELSPKEKLDKAKIETVFDSYSFDTASSEILMNSPILHLIKEAYNEMSLKQAHDVLPAMKRFKDEYNRLKKIWSMNALN